MANLLPTVDISGTVILDYDIQVEREKQILCIIHNVYFFANL